MMGARISILTRMKQAPHILRTRGRYTLGKMEVLLHLCTSEKKQKKIQLCPQIWVYNLPLEKGENTEFISYAEV